MMVETILESSQDFGMSSGPLPQWKRELLQRRAARSRPPQVPPPAPPLPLTPPPPPPPADEDEELRYGPGIVKRLKSRYLSLALREAPRRRPSVLRRAASLEHLLDERLPPPPAPAPRTSARPARPVSLAAPPRTSAAPVRRDSVKRARSVDALSRLDEPVATPSPPPLPRPPRRPAPLLRDAERPPPDVVRSTLRKFESTPVRRTAPAGRVSSVLRGLEAPPRSSTPEPRGRSPSPAAADISAIDEPEGANLSVRTKRVSKAALDGIARAGSTVRYSFESPERGSHLPPLAATNPVLLNRARLSASPRRVGVIKPMPAPALEATTSPPAKAPDSPRLETPPPDAIESVPVPRPERKDAPPSAFVEPIPRTPPTETDVKTDTSASRETTPEVDLKPEPKVTTDESKPAKKATMNGHVTPERVETKTKSLRAAGIERAWTGASANSGVEVASAGRKLRPAAPAATSVVFNFSNRKEVPDYIENDGIVLRASRRNRFKAGEAGVVVLRPEALENSSEDEESEEDRRPPSPCSVRFLNDNVLINGRSSMLSRTPHHRVRAAKLKLQFDDSLTRTFEYPSETSLCEDSPQIGHPVSPLTAPAQPPQPPQPPQPAQPTQPTLASNTHLDGCGGLARYTPSKTLADAFQLGLTRTHQQEDPASEQSEQSENSCKAEAGAEAEADVGDVRPCAAESARSWSESRTHDTDLLF
ncbi:unnamed protein product [Leptosia nina]|uniref:Uncharacterized protein n=1 Tax=Leptosia nina TaxID=320188 RepID=A0AAV1JIU7_9NEOP